jgi:alpha-L-rhamnosidase
MPKLALLLCLLSSVAWTQQASVIPDDQLDPTRHLTGTLLESATHTPLPEQYIWTKADAMPHHPPHDAGGTIEADPQLGKHYFRRNFELGAVPRNAVLYVAGPRSVTVYLNGRLVESFHTDPDDSRLTHRRDRVFFSDVSHLLQKGRNVLAIEAMRGDREALVVKIVPAELGIIAAPVLISDRQWKASMDAAAGWQDTSFNDSGWQAADNLGSIDDSPMSLVGNNDARLYNWPGYDGISPYLEQYELPAVAVKYVYPGLHGRLVHVDALTKTAIPNSEDEFHVQLPTVKVENEAAPHILLDFGREVDGRLAFHSGSDVPSDVTVQYGESEGEALRDPYLGVNPLHVGPHATAYGPKSAFRYAFIRFIGGKDTRYASIQLAGINYPVKYQGFFESSDAELNRMWAVGAYTAHLCMQDDIWDAPKRDRSRWMGDLDVSGRTIEDVFGDRFLMEQTLDKLMGSPPIKQHVNGIAGYSAFWIGGETEYYRHTGSKEQLDAFHDRLIQLMQYMETELDSRNLYANNSRTWPFVDWSPELNGDTPEARRATQMEFYMAFEQGVYLLNQMGDTGNAEAFQKRAALMKAAAQKYLLDDLTNSFGPRWQTNAMAVLSGVADHSQYDAIWNNSLSSVGHIKYNALIVTPYYNYYVVSAMAEMGHRKDALDWIRQYWGGMVDEGATSFWEGYDPAWYKNDFHASLQADDLTGYIVSLAHGWSSGVTPWLMEQILGIHSTGPGFSAVDIRPDLVDLQWVRGGEPTPRGVLKVSMRKDPEMETTIDLPPGTEAHVSVPVSRNSGSVLVNGLPQTGASSENGTRVTVTLLTEGHYVIRAQ